MQRRNFFKALAAGIAALAGVKAVAGPIYMGSPGKSTVIECNGIRFHGFPPMDPTGGEVVWLPTSDAEADAAGFAIRSGDVAFYNGFRWTRHDLRQLEQREKNLRASLMLNRLKTAVRT